MLFRWREVCESLLKGALDDCWTIPKRSMTQVRRHSVAYSRLYRRNTASVASEYVSFGITLAPQQSSAGDLSKYAPRALACPF